MCDVIWFVTSPSTPATTGDGLRGGLRRKGVTDQKVLLVARVFAVRACLFVCTIPTFAIAVAVELWRVGNNRPTPPSIMTRTYSRLLYFEHTYIQSGVQ